MRRPAKTASVATVAEIAEEFGVTRPDHLPASDQDGDCGHVVTVRRSRGGDGHMTAAATA
jgi:hypothetical protein